MNEVNKVSEVSEVNEVALLSLDIYYIIGRHIDNARTFFNFICAIKDIQYKGILIKLKKEEYKKEVIQCYDFPDTSRKVYSIYPNGVLDGEYTEYHDDDLVKIKCHYINGKKHGSYIERSEFANIVILKCNYKDDLLDGEYTEYYDDDLVKIKCHYINGKKHGLYIERSEFANIVILKCNYKDDLLDGDYIEHHYNDSIKIKCYYINGKKHGLYIERLCSLMNTVILKCNYKDDLLDGDYEMWHDDSSNRLKTFYINGVKSHDEICWTVNGDIIRCRGEKYNEYKNKKNGEKTNNASNLDFIFRCKNNESEKVEDYLEQDEIGIIL
jgi:antitoxin component YwqK of YwqJK toxin-antitoxin module